MYNNIIINGIKYYLSKTKNEFQTIVLIDRISAKIIYFFQ